MSLKKVGTAPVLSLNNLTPGSPPRKAPPGSTWYFETDCTEFQPGDQKKGTKGDGGMPLKPSMVKESGESSSCAVFGSLTLTLARMAVRPLYRCGSLGMRSP